MAKQINPNLLNLLKLAELTHNPNLKIDRSMFEKEAERETPDLESPIKNPQDYVQVPKTGYVITKNQTDNGLQYEPTHLQVLQRGLEIPTPVLFTTHLLNVIKAKNGKTKLYDGLGNPLGSSQVEEIYTILTSGCWVWLNAGFRKTREGEDYRAFDIETITGLDSQGNLITQLSPLEKCIWSDSFINSTDSQFNSQGLATKISKAKDYQQGKVIRFWHPKDNCVARFYADSGWADLGCYWYPFVSSPSLGVFVCTREASATQLVQN